MINEDHVSVLSLAMSALSDLSIVEMSAGTVCSQKYKNNKSTILKIFWLEEIQDILVKRDIYDGQEGNNVTANFGWESP